jgi:hypothetical protein
LIGDLAPFCRSLPMLTSNAEGARLGAPDAVQIADRSTFAGSYALVRSYLDAYRVRPDPAAPPPPTVRQVTGWLTRHPPP